MILTIELIARMIMGLGRLDNWSESKSNLWILCTLIAGILTIVLGYGAWRSPRLDWTSFVDAFEQFGGIVFSEIIRMMNDPFAFIGLIVMIVGSVLTINTIKKSLSN